MRADKSGNPSPPFNISWKSFRYADPFQAASSGSGKLYRIGSLVLG